MNRREIPFSPPDISGAEVEEVIRVLQSGWITTGPRTKLLERRLFQYIETGDAGIDCGEGAVLPAGCPRVVCLNSATAAEELILRILGVGPGDEVIVPAYTYTASASAVIHCGAQVRFVDIQKDGSPVTGMPEMDYEKLEQAITERTKAVVTVDLGGILCDYARVFEIVERKKSLFRPKESDGSVLGDLSARIQKALGRCAVLADAAHALGASISDGMLQELSGNGLGAGAGNSVGNGAGNSTVNRAGNSVGNRAGAGVGDCAGDRVCNGAGNRKGNNVGNSEGNNVGNRAVNSTVNRAGNSLYNGACVRRRYCGTIADFTDFSFHAVKNFTTAEGGAAAWLPIDGVPDEEIYHMFQLLSLHGQSKDALAKSQIGAWEYDIVGPWYKCNMTDIMAAIGLRQLDRYPGLLARRAQIIRRYDETCDALGISHLRHYTDHITSSGHLYLIRIPGIGEETRNRLIVRMAEQGVSTNVHYKPLPMMTAYKALGWKIEDFPNAFDYYQNLITLPLHTRLSDEDVEYVCEVLKRSVEDVL